MNTVKILCALTIFIAVISMPLIFMYVFDKRLKNRDKET